MAEIELIFGKEKIPIKVSVKDKCNPDTLKLHTWYFETQYGSVWIKVKDKAEASAT